MIETAIVAGAGIGGLAAALALARRGVAVHVCERAARLEEVGAGLQISPNAVHVLEALGLGAALGRIGFAPARATIRHWRSGRAFLSAPLGETARVRYGAPFLQVHRADLHACLTESAVAAGVVLETGAEAAGVETEGSAATLTLKDGARRSADLLVGADGLQSAVRAAMLGPGRPVFTGQLAWRATVPASRVDGAGIPPDATVFAGPGRHVVLYYLRGGRLLNVVAVEERSDWRGESWTEPGDPDALRAAFAGWHGQVAAALGAVEQVHRWALFDRPPLPRWHEGRVVLLGDACHPTLPFMAQGAAMAIEDAWVLARALASHGRVAHALAAYEAARKPRTSALQSRARENAELFHLKSPLQRAKLEMAGMLRGRAALWPLDGVYGHDVTRGDGEGTATHPGS